MRIGFVYESSFATMNGSNHLLESTIKKMLSQGYYVYLLQSSYSDELRNEYPSEFNCINFSYVPIKMKKVEKNRFIKRYLNGIIFAYKFKNKIQKLDIDLFFIQSCPTASFIIMNAKKKKVPIIYNIHDIFPGSAYELGIIRSNYINTILKKIQKIGYYLSNKIIVVSEDMKEKLIIEKVMESKIEVVHTWFDSKSVIMINNEDNTFIKEYNIDTDKFILQYAGNVGQVFGVNEFSLLVNLLKNDNDIEFHIVGTGIKLEILKEKTKGCNIRFFEWQNHNRMSEIFSYPDVEIIPLHHGVIGYNVPSKMALAMACGKTIINIVEKSYYSNIFQDNNIGYSFEQNETEKLAVLIRKLSHEKRIIKTNKDRIIEFNREYFSFDKNIANVMHIIDSTHKGEC